jgi:hypothetical protein
VRNLAEECFGVVGPKRATRPAVRSQRVSTRNLHGVPATRTAPRAPCVLKVGLGDLTAFERVRKLHGMRVAQWLMVRPSPFAINYRRRLEMARSSIFNRNLFAIARRPRYRGMRRSRGPRPSGPSRPLFGLQARHATRPQHMMRSKAVVRRRSIARVFCLGAVLVLSGVAVEGCRHVFRHRL